MHHAKVSGMDPKVHDCITDCLKCDTICTTSITHCLDKGGKHADPAHIALLIDCAEICRTSADFMGRSSSFSNSSCDLCAQVCDQCAASCEQFRDDQMMRMCAENCRATANSCREMAGMKVFAGA
ncbi:MAG: four-helix bundle copper-binding protein [Alphaproteobacteria bacterium]|uniref:Four-helix bundle copper-binding protein n=1 Tax=Candidatus Nitrobium versatile TaxID=2884831 RepID=A0A953JCK7_9BACT|nr:four-helix bundle copper-binding protein [Candidatus Nitrobium versatile]